MPELPEVEVVRKSLQKKIKQKKIKKVIVRNRNLRIKIPLDFESFLEGKKVIKIDIKIKKNKPTIRILNISLANFCDGFLPFVSSAE